jgi:hypothetical protein
MLWNVSQRLPQRAAHAQIPSSDKHRAMCLETTHGMGKSPLRAA